MSPLSVFDIFKVGIGPSSSHTMGPMQAARLFVLDLEDKGLLERTAAVVVRLYGSLALTGKGHGTDGAILAGLEGGEPATIDPDGMARSIERIRASGRLRLAGRHEIGFDEPMQLLFLRAERLPAHPNGMRFAALDSADRVLHEAEMYSIGGGFVARAGEAPAGDASDATFDPSATGSGAPPYPFTSAAELLERCRAHGLEIYELMLANEQAWRPVEAVREGLLDIWRVMRACV